ncbi:hypothetical protein M408DRAFT_326140 [Serendipita vermifera MAFF 305830]|uniref:Carbohydrate kinase PfkB domain-containing protein n=1 Tax=Serendipita vermifera MAFF 305830 TaxID=933852 RepID=A0A0C2X5L4_SERVB|nr:hypothetical protein M408DRAFT_326140 [Serendipita vermifera MAFF 305830]
MFLPANQISMLVDRGNDFGTQNQEILDSYGPDIWIFRNQADRGTTRALNLYRGEVRGFEYLTPRIRITPKEFSPSNRARYLHFICSPKRAQEIMSEVDEIAGWTPITIFEPIPDRCVPSELPALKAVLPKIAILSPNANEACSLLSLVPADGKEPSKQLIEKAASIFYGFGSDSQSNVKVVIRSGELGVYIKDSPDDGLWIDAYWGAYDSGKVVDVTGAGNAFLGGLAAGLSLCDDDVRKAAEYATISASFTIEKHGLPVLKEGLWNGERAEDRLHAFASRAHR